MLMKAFGGSLERSMPSWIVVVGGAPGRCSLEYLLKIRGIWLSQIPRFVCAINRDRASN